MHYYCTYFDVNYLPRALALYDSLRVHDGPFVLDVLCLDAQTYKILQRLALPEIRVISLHNLENADPGLVKAKTNRSWLEYIWSLTPSLIKHCLEHNPDANLVTYLDADLYFYSSPEPVFAELDGSSIGLIPHRYCSDISALVANNGIYNVGMMPFRRDAVSDEALSWWREQCLMACHAKPTDGKFGDQKYLDDWPTRFSGVTVINHPGANLAPWNVAGHRIAKGNGKLTVDNVPLIFYHFHALDIFGPHWYRCGARGITRKNINIIYRPYLQALRGSYARLNSIKPNFTGGYSRVTIAAVWKWFRYRRLHFIYEP